MKNHYLKKRVACKRNRRAALGKPGPQPTWQRALLWGCCWQQWVGISGRAWSKRRTVKRTIGFLGRRGSISQGVTAGEKREVSGTVILADGGYSCIQRTAVGSKCNPTAASVQFHNCTLTPNTPFTKGVCQAADSSCSWKSPSHSQLSCWKHLWAFFN